MPQLKEALSSKTVPVQVINSISLRRFFFFPPKAEKAQHVSNLLFFVPRVGRVHRALSLTSRRGPAVRFAVRTAQRATLSRGDTALTLWNSSASSRRRKLSDSTSRYTFTHSLHSTDAVAFTPFHSADFLLGTNSPKKKVPQSGSKNRAQFGFKSLLRLTLFSFVSVFLKEKGRREVLRSAGAQHNSMLFNLDQDY